MEVPANNLRRCARVAALLITFTFARSLHAVDPSQDELNHLAAANRDAQKTGICELHHVAMTKREIPIHWGEAIPPGPDTPAYACRMHNFPNFVEYVEGGCCRIPGKKFEVLFICPQCEKAAKAWKTESTAR